MIEYESITHVEIELSSFCNAECPLCPRNLFGYSYNNGYDVKHLSLEEIKKIFDKSFLNQIKKITFEGNFGDPLMNPELLEILDYLNKPVSICTNGSLQNEKFWKNLATKNVIVEFGIDGLSGTHEIYRRKTNFNKIIDNAKTFISSGGKAVWKMIKFDHNQHQIKDCEKLSKDLGFKNFYLVNHGRDSGLVFNSDGNLERVIGNFTGNLTLNHYKSTIEKGDIFLEDVWDKPKNKINCQAIKNNSIYVASNGEVYPCCFMGFSPRTYGHGQWHQPVNAQIKQLLQPNNALERPLKECIEWFSNIPSCWDKKTFEEGRLVVCDKACGS